MIPSLPKPIHIWGYLSLLFLLACQPQKIPTPPPVPTTPAPVFLRLGVSESAGRLIELLPPAYTQQTQQAILQLITGNEENLYADMEAGILDAILIHQIPSNSSAWFNPVAADGLVFLVHPENPIQDLTLSQLQAIFSGRIHNWAEVGGLDQPILLFSRETEAGSWLVVQDRVLEEQRLAITAIIQGSDLAIQKAVAQESAGIGYSMIGNQQTSPPTHPLSIAHIPANPTTTANQTYPLTIPLYFLTPNEPTGELRAFLAWIQSPTGQTLLSPYYGQVNQP